MMSAVEKAGGGAEDVANRGWHQRELYDMEEYHGRVMHRERRWIGARIDDRKDRDASSWKVTHNVLILDWKSNNRQFTRQSDHFSAQRTLALRENQ